LKGRSLPPARAAAPSSRFGKGQSFVWAHFYNRDLKLAFEFGRNIAYVDPIGMLGGSTAVNPNFAQSC
jgi:hypothetical protein